MVPPKPKLLDITVFKVAPVSVLAIIGNFLAYSSISEMDEDAKKFPIVAKTETGVSLNTVMSNSFGFGGTNAALIFEKV